MFERIAYIRNIDSVMELASICAKDKLLFAELMQIVRNGTEKEQIKASWIVTHAVELQNSILEFEHYQLIIDVLNSTESGSIKRNLIRTIQFAAEPNESLCLELFGIALKLLSDQQQDLAVRVFSITVLQNYLKYAPELTDEILFILERELPESKPFFKVRANRFQKFIEKQKQLKR